MPVACSLCAISGGDFKLGPNVGGQVGAEKQEAQLMLTTGSTRLAVSRGQQTWYHSTCNI